MKSNPQKKSNSYIYKVCTTFHYLQHILQFLGRYLGTLHISSWEFSFPVSLSLSLYSIMAFYHELSKINKLKPIRNSDKVILQALNSGRQASNFI